MTSDREELDALDLRRRLTVSAFSSGGATTDRLAGRRAGAGLALGIVIGILGVGGVLLPRLVATGRPKPARQDAVAVDNAANVRPQPGLTASLVAPTPTGSLVPVDTPAGPAWADSSDAATSPAAEASTTGQAPPTVDSAGVPAAAPSPAPAAVPPARVTHASPPRSPTVQALCQQLIPTGVGRVTTRRIEVESGSEVGVLVRPAGGPATAYLVLSRRVYRIGDTRSLIALGYRAADVRGVTSAWFARLSPGAPFAAPLAGRVLHDVAGHAYYLWDGRMVHRVQGLTTLLVAVRSGGSPQPVSHDWVTRHRHGTRVRAAGLPPAPPPVVAPGRGALLACLPLDGRAGVRILGAPNLG